MILRPMGKARTWGRRAKWMSFVALLGGAACGGDNAKTGDEEKLADGGERGTQTDSGTKEDASTQKEDAGTQEDAGKPGIEDDDEVAKLSADDIETLCDEYVAAQTPCADFERITDCIFEALFADTAAVCMAQIPACVAGEREVPASQCDDPDNPEDSIDCTTATRKTCIRNLGAKSCGGTVGEFRACGVGLKSSCEALAFPPGASGWDCSVAKGQATDITAAQDALENGPHPDFDAPDACAAFEKKCPAE